MTDDTRARWPRWRDRPTASGLPPTTPRPNRRTEAQRVEALELVTRHAAHIYAAASQNDIAPEAVAGAIVWEGVENPYRRRFARLGPGKVRPIKPLRKSDAQRVEGEGRIRPASGALERFARVRDPVWAIYYVAAVIGRHADIYEKLGGVRIRDDVGILCTLYQGGGSEQRATRFARRREEDSFARPAAADDMGPWVLSNLGFVRSLLEGGPVTYEPETRARLLS